MKIIILVVGENKSTFLREAENNFIVRLKHYCKFEIRSVREEKIRPNQPKIDILVKEGKRLLEKVENDAFLVVADSDGVQLDSISFSKQIEKWQNRGIRSLIFAIGGPLGIDESVKKRANYTLSLSKMTFTHDMARVILLEQVYRAFTIIRGEKYHK